MTENDHIIISAARYLSRKECFKDSLTGKWMSRPLYTFEQVVYYLYVPVKFLQDNGLLTRKLVDGPESITEDFELRKSDLTELGYEMFRVAHSKWLAALDRKAVGKAVDATDAEGIRQEWLRSGKADQIFKTISKS
jgi:hypothetical protein